MGGWVGREVLVYRQTGQGGWAFGGYGRVKKPKEEEGNLDTVAPP